MEIFCMHMYLCLVFPSRFFLFVLVLVLEKNSRFFFYEGYIARRKKRLLNDMWCAIKRRHNFWMSLKLSTSLIFLKMRWKRYMKFCLKTDTCLMHPHKPSACLSQFLSYENEEKYIKSFHKMFNIFISQTQSLHI